MIIIVMALYCENRISGASTEDKILYIYVRMCLSCGNIEIEISDINRICIYMYIYIYMCVCILLNIEHGGDVSPENCVRYQFNAFEKMTSGLQFFFTSSASWLLHARLRRRIQHTPVHLCIDI
jgi:hypothetical protein